VNAESGSRVQFKFDRKKRLRDFGTDGKRCGERMRSEKLQKRNKLSSTPPGEKAICYVSCEIGTR
jgi:hypothetical protein